MQDVIRHHIIPRAPFEFVSVAKWTQQAALDAIQHATISPRESAFYRAIKLLGGAARFDALRQFMTCNYDIKLFIDKMMQISDSGVDYKHEIIAIYQYIEWLDETIVGEMLWAALYEMNIDYQITVLQILPHAIISHALVHDHIYSIFLDRGNYYYITKYSDQYYKNIIDFAIRWFPDIIHEYVNYILRHYKFASRGCDERVKFIKMAVERSRDIFDAELYWSNVLHLWKCDMEKCAKELHKEISGKLTNKSPLFARLRRRAHADVDAVKTVYKAVMRDLVHLHWRKRFNNHQTNKASLQVQSNATI